MEATPFSETMRSALAALFVRRVSGRWLSLHGLSAKDAAPAGWTLAYKEHERNLYVYAPGWTAWLLRMWWYRWSVAYRLCLVGAWENGGYFVPSKGGYWAWPPAEFRKRVAEGAPYGQRYSLRYGWGFTRGT